jgi:hypothetical protein
MEFFPQTISNSKVASGEWPVAGKNAPSSPLPTTNPWALATLLVSGFWFLVSATGCVTLPKSEKDEMPHGQVYQAVTTWNHQVVFAPDPVHGGAEQPGLVGRLYLFGKEISFPLIEEGSLVVDLYDDTQPPPQTESGPTSGPGQQTPLEEWRFDPVSLKKLAKKDMIGWGYTVFLPWGTYRPEINQVHLKVRYVTAKDIPFFAESGPLSLQKPVMTASHHVVTVGGKSNVPATGPAGLSSTPPNSLPNAVPGFAQAAPSGQPAAVR